MGRAHPCSIAMLNMLNTQRVIPINMIKLFSIAMCRISSIHSMLYLVGGFNPSEKYESQLGLFFPIHGKSENSCSKPPTRDIYIYLYKSHKIMINPQYIYIVFIFMHIPNALHIHSYLQCIYIYIHTYIIPIKPVCKSHKTSIYIYV